MYYCQSRYYDPQTHRFLNADAFASTGQGLLGNNMFAYCQNNPVMYSDPSGTLLIEALIVIGAGILIGAATGAYMAACDGGDTSDIIEGTIEGGLTGGTSAALGFFLSPIAAVFWGTIAGVGIDFGVQYTSHRIRGGTHDNFDLDTDRMIETGITTGLSSGIKGLENAGETFTNYVPYAIGTAIYSAEASVLISSSVIAYHRVRDKISNTKWEAMIDG